MLEQLLSMAQSHLGENLPNQQALQGLGVNTQQVAGVTSQAVLDSLMQQMQNGDLSGIQEMLSGADTSAESPAVNGLMPNVTSQLSNKLNLSPGLAQTLAAVAIPLILNMLNGRVNQAQQGGMDVGGMLGGLLGGGGSGSAGGGLLGSVLGGMMGGGNTASRPQQGGGQDMLGGLLGGLFK